MAHKQQQDFFKYVKRLYPDFFWKKFVLDIGSLDINGSNKELFYSCGYIGVDLKPGKNVDIYSCAHELKLPDETFDVVISAECFEHDKCYKQSIPNLVRLLKSGGLFTFTCATHGRPEHGTRKTSPSNAPFLEELGEWGDYYKNLDESDIREIIPVDSLFQKYEFSTNEETHDLYFWGIKNGILQNAEYSFLEKENKIKSSHYDLNQFENDSVTAKRYFTQYEDELFYLKHQINETKNDLSQSLELSAFRLSEITKHKVWEARQDTIILDQQEKIKELESMGNLYESQIRNILNSKSWRLSAPLRFLGRVARFFFPNLRNWVDSDVSESISNQLALDFIIRTRCKNLKNLSNFHNYLNLEQSNLPEVDICVVTFNSEKWIDKFLESLISINYPKNLLKLSFADNNSQDNTFQKLLEKSSQLQSVGFQFEIFKRPNRGFGTSQNYLIKNGKAPFILVTNIDLTFDREALKEVISNAINDEQKVASWELRQKPFEHPKYYDPITGLTNWSSHACVLLRRSALKKVGGYDESLFMYGEDVELSYKLRRNGFLLRYIPKATIWHYSYGDKQQIKPLQYVGSLYANLYLRLKYGGWADIKVIPKMAMQLLLNPGLFPGSRKQLSFKLLKLILNIPKALSSRKKSDAFFPFQGWDYGLNRLGAFFEQKESPSVKPLVTIITRTFKGRELYLKQAILSVANQTWTNIEHIIIEDFGTEMKDLVEDLNKLVRNKLIYKSNPNKGRSRAGNLGLSIANGEYGIFLDDDDLLFADHVETLVNTLLANPQFDGAYSTSWEVVTDFNSTDEAYKESGFKTDIGQIQEFNYEILLKHNFMTIQSVLFKISLYKEFGGFYENIEFLEDWTLWVRYASKNGFIFVPKTTSMYRTPANPLQIINRNRTLLDAREIALNLNQKFLEKKN